MYLSLKKYKLKLQHTFTISRESHDVQDSLIVSLKQNGLTGYGEATSNPYYNITVDGMMQEIEEHRDFIENHDLTDVAQFHASLKDKGLGNFSLCALDLAAHDLYGKLREKPLYKLWGTTTDNYPITNYTIGLDTIPKMLAKMQEKPWPIYKIKLGTPDDVAIIKELRRHTDAIFRVDANCAWDAATAIKNSMELKKLGVEFLEQPLAASDRSGMKMVKEESVLPIIADESCIIEEDVEKCHGLFNGVNIKLTKCGGLTPALRMIKKAKSLDLKVMMGCMTESTVGISAIGQLLPQLDYVDMDGAMLLKQDIATGIEIHENGKVIFPQLGGSGIELS